MRCCFIASGVLFVCLLRLLAITMDANLIGRSVAERMFVRESTVLDGLLNITSTPVRVIERHLAELAARWITLQENTIHMFASLLQNCLKFLLMMHLLINTLANLFVWN